MRESFSINRSNTFFKNNSFNIVTITKGSITYLINRARHYDRLQTCALIESKVSNPLDAFRDVDRRKVGALVECLDANFRNAVNLVLISYRLRNGNVSRIRHIIFCTVCDRKSLAIFILIIVYSARLKVVGGSGRDAARNQQRRHK